MPTYNQASDLLEKKNNNNKKKRVPQRLKKAMIMRVPLDSIHVS